jgi:hypothetical protein
MRLELSGSKNVLRPIILVYTENGTFDAAGFQAMGYTNFDVIIIGGGGGRGGNTYGEDTEHPGFYVKTFGGEGGGGGFLRVKGILRFLPSSMSVVVGQGGAPGTDSIDADPFDPDATTPGGDGGYSQFFTGTTTAGAACRGGFGGSPSISRSREDSSNANGGAGGYPAMGTGGAGGEAEIVAGIGGGGNTPPTAGEDGSFLHSIFGLETSDWWGGGGGGGPGGIESVTPGSPPTNGVTRAFSEKGGRGSYSVSDPSVYGIGGENLTDLETGGTRVVPGFGGGARTTPLNGSYKMYGRAGQPGVVAIRLTAV